MQGIKKRRGCGIQEKISIFKKAGGNAGGPDQEACGAAGAGLSSGATGTAAEDYYN